MNVFTEITLLVVIATLVAFLMRLLRQPLVIGYILTGLLVGPMFFDLVKSEEVINLFSEIGIALLLFIVGLNLTPAAIKAFGKAAIVTGLGQVIFTLSIGWIISSTLGFSPIESLYLGIALAFSSTIIILKLLSDKGDLEKLYGKISIGFLLVQDFIAVLILFLIPLFSTSPNSFLVITKIFAGFATLGLIYLISHFLLPKLNRFISRSQETLFLFAIAWGLGLASLFKVFGFSLESGALIAGATLSILPSHDEIHSRLKPLRDFFIILFFILLGAKMVVAGSAGLFWPAVILSLFVLIGNPLILLIIMGISGYRKKTSFQTGLTVAQISEFSLIVVATGVKLNHIDSSILSLTTVVGIITIFVSTYLIMNSDALFKIFGKILSVFEKQNARDALLPHKESEMLLFGLNRVGYDFIKSFGKLKKPYLIIDHNPETIDRLVRQKLPHIFGDAGDTEFLRILDWSKVKLVVSTIPEVHTNKLIMDQIISLKKPLLFLSVALNAADAKSLYSYGADYVLIPHFLGGQHASELIESIGFDKKKFRIHKKKHLKYLDARVAHEKI